MHYFHGFNKKTSFFEGWYYKHQSDSNTVAFIPGISIDENGNKTAFIQIFDDERTYFVNYDFSQFKISRNKLAFKIGNNVFTEKGISLDITDENITVKGKLKYGEFTRIKYDIMGPFKFLPFMECSHGIISLRHSVDGKLMINEKSIEFTNGKGYIETDWGSSFPKSYFWTHCGSFANLSRDEENQCSIMLSVADIPYMGFNFKGCICVIYYKGKEYRLATYKGAKIIMCSRKCVRILQGKYYFTVEFEESGSQELAAPSVGNMNRTISESISCTARYKFYKNSRQVFSLVSKQAGFEFEDNQIS